MGSSHWEHNADGRRTISWDTYYNGSPVTPSYEQMDASTMIADNGRQYEPYLFLADTPHCLRHARPTRGSSWHNGGRLVIAHLNRHTDFLLGLLRHRGFRCFVPPVGHGGWWRVYRLCHTGHSIYRKAINANCFLIWRPPIVTDTQFWTHEDVLYRHRTADYIITQHTTIYAI